MYRNKGTITVFLSLISMLFLSLFCTMAESVRVQAARFQAAAAFDMGLFSIFGEYDRVLLEEYDLWFLDGSSEEQKIREVLETKLEKYIQPNINPRYNLAAGRSWDVFPTELDRCTVDKYALVLQSGCGKSERTVCRGSGISFKEKYKTNGRGASKRRRISK